MMALSVMTALLLTAEPVRVAAPGFSVHALEQKAGDFYSDQVSQQLSFQGLNIITRSEVEALLGNERQKQLLGCTEERSACTTELAGALGSEALLLGDAAKVGDKYRLSIRIVRVTNGERLSSAVVTGSTEDAVLDAFGVVSKRMALETTAKLTNQPVPEEAQGVSTSHLGSRRFFWAPLAVGVAGVVWGAVAFGQSKTRHDRLRSGEQLTQPEPSALRNEGQSWQVASWVGFGVGGAGLIASALLFILGSDSVVETGVAFVPGGAVGSFAGRF